MLHGRREAGPTEEPWLFLGLNTLPDQPSPFPGYLGFPVQPGAWAACGGNLMVFLMSAVRSMRARPAPPGSAFGPEYHRIQKLLRQDAILMSYPAYLVLPEEGPAGRAILDNLAEGYLPPGDLDLSPGARPTELVRAVDRSGSRLVMAGPPGAADDTVHVLGAGDTTGEGAVILDLLADILDTQYAWTHEVFG